MASKNLKVRPINEADIRAFYNKPFVQSLRGLTVESENEPVFIAFVVNTSPPQAVSWMKDELRKHPKMILKAAKEFIKIMEKYPCDIYAVADEEEKNSECFLKRIGFTHLIERLYVWLN